MNQPMRVLVTGVCGFVGKWLAELLASTSSQKSNLIPSSSGPFEVWGMDNLSRVGSESNRNTFQKSGIRFVHGDVRCSSDLESLPKFDWIIDCAAIVSVLSGVHSSSRRLVETNLIGTLNLLELCRRDRCGMILLSTSRVYGINAIKQIELETIDEAFTLANSNQANGLTSNGITPNGITEAFSTDAPTSLYAATKLASERLTHEYSLSFGFPLRINRCGVMAGAGQFGNIEQGIVSYWIHSRARKMPLKYIGYGAKGHQVRDCLHPSDLARLVIQQMNAGVDESKPVTVNVGGGLKSSRSLCQLNRWCDQRFGPQPIFGEESERLFDVPWLVLDPSIAEAAWGWQSSVSTEQIWAEIADEAERKPHWLERTVNEQK